MGPVVRVWQVMGEPLPATAPVRLYFGAEAPA